MDMFKKDMTKHVLGIEARGVYGLHLDFIEIFQGGGFAFSCQNYISTVDNSALVSLSSKITRPLEI